MKGAPLLARFQFDESVNGRILQSDTVPRLSASMSSLSTPKPPYSKRG